METGKIVKIIILVILITSCTTSKNYEIGDYPYITLGEKYSEMTILSPYDGEVISIEKEDETLSRVIIISERKFYTDHEVIKREYEIVISGLANIYTETNLIKENEAIGVITDASYITFRVPHYDNYLSARSIGKGYNKYWWFIPEWITESKIDSIVKPRL